MKKIIFLSSLTILLFSCNQKQEKTINSDVLSSEEKIDSTNIKTLFDAVLTDGKSYEWLRDLTQNIGQRLSGSEGAAKSVIWGELIMRGVGLDSVWLQPVMVPHWVRGEKEIATYMLSFTRLLFNSLCYFCKFINLFSKSIGFSLKISGSNSFINCFQRCFYVEFFA
jgi:hypothetical protein